MPSQFPALEVAIEAKFKADEDRLAAALSQLATEDPSFGLASDHGSGQTVLKGVSERHLDAQVDRLRLLSEININIGAPQVAYRETLVHRNKETRGDAVIIDAVVPMAALFGYDAQLRALSQGRARYTTQFDHYAKVTPPDGDGPLAPAIALRP